MKKVPAVPYLAEECVGSVHGTEPARTWYSGSL